MKDHHQLHDLQQSITAEITEENNKAMAESMAQKRREAAIAQANYQDNVKAMEAAGIKMSQLQALDVESTRKADEDVEDIKARMDGESHTPLPAVTQPEVEGTFLPPEAQLLRPTWVAAFSDDDFHDTATEASVINAQDLLTGGGCKNFRNWAKGAGSGLAGTGEGKVQSWVYFGFWFRPPTSRFYSIRPLFRYRGYVIVKADDGFFTSKRARVVGSAWVNVHQYNWKGWNNVTVYDNQGDNINLNTRRDIDRYTNSSYLLGGGDWAWISCAIGLYAYARGGGSYAENNFSTGAANYLCVPHCYVV